MEPWVCPQVTIKPSTVIYTCKPSVWEAEVWRSSMSPSGTQQENNNKNLWLYYLLWLLNHKRGLFVKHLFHDKPLTDSLVLRCNWVKLPGVPTVSSGISIDLSFFRGISQIRTDIYHRYLWNSSFKEELHSSAILPSLSTALTCQSPNPFHRMQAEAKTA